MKSKPLGWILYCNIFCSIGADSSTGSSSSRSISSSSSSSNSSSLVIVAVIPLNIVDMLELIEGLSLVWYVTACCTRSL